MECDERIGIFRLFASSNDLKKIKRILNA